MAHDFFFWELEIWELSRTQRNKINLIKKQTTKKSISPHPPKEMEKSIFPTIDIIVGLFQT